LTESIPWGGDVERDDLDLRTETEHPFVAMENNDEEALKNIPMLGQPFLSIP
jgi:hypothetical protein